MDYVCTSGFLSVCVVRLWALWVRIVYARVCVYVSAFVGFIDVVLQALVNLIVGYLWVYVSVCVSLGLCVLFEMLDLDLVLALG